MQKRVALDLLICWIDNITLLPKKQPYLFCMHVLYKYVLLAFLADCTNIWSITLTWMLVLCIVHSPPLFSVPSSSSPSPGFCALWQLTLKSHHHCLYSLIRPWLLPPLHVCRRKNVKTKTTVRLYNKNVKSYFRIFPNTLTSLTTMLHFMFMSLKANWKNTITRGTLTGHPLEACIWLKIYSQQYMLILL